VFKKRSSKNAAVVGLELDPGHVAAAEVTVNGSVTLTRGAMAMLRPGIVRDGEVADAAGLAETLRGLFDEHDLPRRVRLGIANQRIVVRTLDLPPLQDDKAMAAAVKVQAPDHIPMPMDEAVLDWQSLGMVTTPLGPRSRVVSGRWAPARAGRGCTSTSPDSPTSPWPTPPAACSRARRPAGSRTSRTRCPSAAA
jgi:type IV pilus assembly protein PilM